MGKRRKKKNLPHSSGCRTEAPIETRARSTDLSPSLLLDVSREDDYIASLKQTPSYSSVCLIGQVFNPMGLGAR